MGNILSDLEPSDLVLGLFGSFAVTYSGFYIYKDYKKKGVIPIKNIERGQNVSIEGRIRNLKSDLGSYNPIYEKKNVYTLVQGTPLSDP